MELGNLDRLEVVVVARSKDAWVADELRTLVQAGRVSLINADKHPEVLENLGMKAEELVEPLVLVSPTPDDPPDYCVLSHIGDSIIVHCPGQVVPLR